MLIHSLPSYFKGRISDCESLWLRGRDSNPRFPTYEDGEMTNFSTPQYLIGARYQIRTGPFCLEGKHASR